MPGCLDDVVGAPHCAPIEGWMCRHYGGTDSNNYIKFDIYIYSSPVSNVYNTSLTYLYKVNNLNLNNIINGQGVIIHFQS